jgi:hypothetical protein
MYSAQSRSAGRPETCFIAFHEGDHTWQLNATLVLFQNLPIGGLF